MYVCSRLFSHSKSASLTCLMKVIGFSKGKKNSKSSWLQRFQKRFKYTSSNVSVMKKNNVFLNFTSPTLLTCIIRFYTFDQVVCCHEVHQFIDENTCTFYEAVFNLGDVCNWLQFPKCNIWLRQKCFFEWLLVIYFIEHFV